MNAIIIRSANAAAPILLCLHGVGEAFRNAKIRSRGVRNLLLQGVPRLLCAPDAVLSPRHPLMQGAFTVVAPQLPDRDTPWQDRVDQIGAVLDTIAARDQRKVYVVGFSKGGKGAFDIAAAIGCVAFVTIDASPMTNVPDGIAAVAKQMAACRVPFWAIWTEYPTDHALHRIPTLHEQVGVHQHDAGSWDELTAPSANTAVKSRIVMDHEAADNRHGALCSAICASAVPYAWLQAH